MKQSKRDKQRCVFVGRGGIFFLTKEGPFNKVKFSSSQKEAGEAATEMPGRGHSSRENSKCKGLGVGSGSVCSRLQGIDGDEGDMQLGMKELGADGSCLRKL